MKVRIVKCTGDFWYKNQINGEFYVTTTKEGTCFNLKATNSGISEFGMLKEDCEIIEADEPKPGPFDSFKAISGMSVQLICGIPVNNLVWVEQISMFVGEITPDERYHAGYSKSGKIIKMWNQKGEVYTGLSDYDRLEMAPREPEYKTVWVNVSKEEASSGIGLQSSCAFYSKDKAEEYSYVFGANFIGTFPITFKKP